MVWYTLACLTSNSIAHVSFVDRLQSAARLLSPLVNLGPNWTAASPLAHSPLESYSKEDLWRDTSDKWKNGHLVGKYKYALLADVTEYRSRVEKMSTLGSWMLSGKNSKCFPAVDRFRRL